MNIQQFLNLQPGEKYTMWWFGNFGFPTCQQIKVVNVECRKYAQYDKSIKLLFTKKGGRRLLEMNILPKEAFIIWPGWITPDSEMYGQAEERENGVTVRRSKFASFDRGYVQAGLDSVSIQPVVIQQ